MGGKNPGLELMRQSYERRLLKKYRKIVMHIRTFETRLFILIIYSVYTSDFRRLSFVNGLKRWGWGVGCVKTSVVFHKYCSKPFSDCPPPPTFHGATIGKKIYISSNYTKPLKLLFPKIAYVPPYPPPPPPHPPRGSDSQADGWDAEKWKQGTGGGCKTQWIIKWRYWPVRQHITCKMSKKA